ncbi:hypothetical protein N7510_000707 [Penicillium lagena]|uniref:uncharacterized protein n=1 Tax=Penicillium lagena TaxID=94218 RepID=UPI002540898E|nr:uncharacterized protein N7510_000707 [Penicillium lagena]KAJ5624398.1 hypothetical protein N7510_000707 [Penicillium lagena]
MSCVAVPGGTWMAEATPSALAGNFVVGAGCGRPGARASWVLPISVNVEPCETPRWLKAGGDETLFPELQEIARASGCGGGGKIRCTGKYTFVLVNAAPDD